MINRIKIEFIYHKPAKNFFKKHTDVKEKFKKNIVAHVRGEYNNNIIKMVGYNDLFRMRIGTYRVIYKIKNNEIILIDVLDADNRGDRYKNY